MTDYKAPVRDIRFALDHIIGYEDLTAVPAFAEATPDFVATVLEEAGKFTAEVLAPLRRSGDQEGARIENGQVRTASGFADAYRQYYEAGWNGMSLPPDVGGQGLPLVLASAMQEMISSANMAFGLCPLLSQGAVSALMAHGSKELQDIYLPKLVSGEWTGAMDLTEPQAGSDVGALRTKAERHADGTYRITGQKIFITYGDHDMAENIVHLVLARLPDAPAGTKGISLFLVPKYLVNPDGSLGQRNDMRPVSLEHKMGIHASPTCVMSFGDNGACVGYLIGQENQGMRSMFTMMNHARLNVGIQGIGQAELAGQQAVDYARQRIQGKPMGAADAKAPIIEHADIRRMIYAIKSQVEAARALALLNAKAIDLAHYGADAEARAKYQGLADLLTPLTKGYGSDLGVEAASLAIQVHGGMGFIEETGVAQTLRDARITPIYEGTNGIQALDLIGRKLDMDGGVHWQALFDEMDAFIRSLPGDDLRTPLASALKTLREVTDWVVRTKPQNMRAATAGATPYLRLFAMMVGGYLLAKGAVAAAAQLQQAGADAAYLKARIAMARFFMTQLLPQAVALAPAITGGDEVLFAIDADQFAA
jgi:alkylation response protein AidB-like acyl-CoA dehydrogenase